MALVFIGLGTNLGDKTKNLNEAIRLIGFEAGAIMNVSSFYPSKPWGFESENNFLNAAILISTKLNPIDLLEKTQQIEKKMGRAGKTTSVYSDRIIDIDILLYDNRIIKHPVLEIPHPMLHKRDFVLVPLAEIAPELIHPVLNETLINLKDRLVPIDIEALTDRKDTNKSR